MKRCVWLVVCAFVLAVFPIGCGTMSDNDFEGKGEEAFQDNRDATDEDPYPNFRILDIFDGRGALEEIWDSVDGQLFIARLNCSIDNYYDDYIGFSDITAAILTGDTQPVAGLMSSDLEHLMGFMLDESAYFLESPDDIGAFYIDSPGVYADNFYSFLDKLWEGDNRPGDEQILDMSRTLIRWLMDTRTPLEIQEDMQDLVDDIRDDDFDREFTRVASLLGKLTLQADYPNWIDETGQVLNKVDIDPTTDTNTGMGNAVQGTNDYVSWINDMLTDSSSHDLMYDTLREAVKLVKSDNAEKLKVLLQNIEDYFTVGGAVYEEADSLYKSETSDPIYTDTELGQTLREFMPFVAQTLARSDRDIALVGHDEGDTPHYILGEMVKILDQIGFDPDVLSIEDSLTMMMQHDLLGRDRLVEDSGAFPTPMLESLFFLTGATTHFGFSDGNNSGEVSDPDNPTYDHGHGAYTEALSLNDSLISLTTYKTQESNAVVDVDLGLYDIAMQPGDNNFLFRSNAPFTEATRDSYQFDFDQDYPILKCLAGASAGDYGHKLGGNRTGEVVPAKNTYTPYNPTGGGETQLAEWTMNWGLRSCFGGEGPYYFADPEMIETTLVNGKNYYTYYRPDGRIYAFVNKDNPEWEYLYPTEEGDEEDPDTDVLDYNDKRQRFNRYKSTWHTDYYMYQRDALSKTIGNSNGEGPLEILDLNAQGDAGRLTYHELIPEDNSQHTRACSSAEEAFFRNYQWVYTEKKMVLIIEKSLTVNVADVATLNIDGGIGYGVAFLVFEAHGWSGLANMRIFEDNHEWAKDKTTGSSTIPGDFRVEVAVEVEVNMDDCTTPLCTGIITGPATEAIVRSQMTGMINNESVYDETLGRGHATPAIVGKNLPALYRLAFPISPEMNRDNGVFDVEVGSRDFQANDEDEIWQNRNAFAPFLLSLLQAINKDRTLPETCGDLAPLKNGIRGHLNSFAPLLKPLMYYSKAEDTNIPTETWKVRVQTAPNSTEWLGEPYLRPSIGFNGEVRWDGTDDEWQHYQPAVLKTPFNVLIDSDITAPQADGKRMDGVLPVITQTRVVSQLLKVLMSDTNANSDKLYSALEQITGAIKYTPGTLTEINRAVGAPKYTPFPDWMFATGGDEVDEYSFYRDFTGVRDEDIILDVGLDQLIGHNSVTVETIILEGYGLANYVDEQEAEEENWADFNETVADLEDLLQADSPYSLLELFFDMQDAMFVRETPVTDDQIRGMIYTLGKLFSRYNTDETRWQVQGDEDFKDLYTILKVRIPAIHDLIVQGDDAGANYELLLRFYLNDMLAEETPCGVKGTIPWLLDTMSTDDGAENIMTAFRALLTEDFVSDPAPLWTDLANLLKDMATALESTQDVDIDQLYDQYGFQRN